MNRGRILIIVDILLFGFLILLVIIQWCRIKKSEVNGRWFGSSSPDGEYFVTANYESFALYPPPTNVDIQLFDKTGIMGGYYVSVNAAEKALGKEDYNVEWYDDYVKIKTRDNCGKENIVRIYWLE